MRFALADVEPAQKLLPTITAREVLLNQLFDQERQRQRATQQALASAQKLVKGFDAAQQPEFVDSSVQRYQNIDQLEAGLEWMLPSPDMVSITPGHAAMMALYYTFQQHRPLALSPDMVWLMVCQGVAQHINNNAEALRHLIVDFPDKQIVTVQRDTFLQGDPNNDWNGVIVEWTLKTSALAPQLARQWSPRFSTTDHTSRLAATVAFLESVHQFVDFELVTLCGIPELELEGTVEDWQQLHQRAQQFRRYDLDWWLKPLEPVFQQFIAAAQGFIDHDWWNSIYKYHAESGQNYITGWIHLLFPYLRNKQGAVTRRNPCLLQFNTEKAIYDHDLPYGLSRVPFVWHCQTQSWNMEIVGGFIGVGQRSDGTLRPQMSYAIIHTAPAQ